jgi:predicted RNA-binding protein with PUA-like domain
VYSYDDLERDGSTMWDGVTNNAALKNIRQMQEGDLAVIYHTGDERAAVGIADVVRGYYVNPEHDDAKLAVCDVRAKSRLPKPVTLAQVKAHPDLQTWDLVRQARLSVLPVNDDQWKILCALSEE